MIQSPLFWLLLMVAVVVFWIIPRSLRDGFLSAASFAYLASLDPSSVIALLGWSVVFYLASPRAAKPGGVRRVILPLLILMIIGNLAFYKYVPQITPLLSGEGVPASVVVPLGISYFTFKLIHYSIEVARGNITDRSFQRFSCYVFLFPIFTAGPIERFDHFLAQRDESWRLQTTVEGATRILHGLIKMFVFARLIQPSESVASLVAGLGELEVYKLWGVLLRTYLYAYMDFSAYSDIAIGAARLFGFRIMENFNLPILAFNIREFWRRWHMTLAGWCQAYVYLPVIGLTRRPYVAVYATFLAMGLWHGGSWNWVFWGLYHATGVSVNLTWQRVKRKLGWSREPGLIWRGAGVALTFAFVTGSYAFSSTVRLGPWAAVRVFARLFGVDLPA